MVLATKTELVLSKDQNSHEAAAPEAVLYLEAVSLATANARGVLSMNLDSTP